MSDNVFDVSAPWEIDGKAKIAVVLGDKSLIGSDRHFLRFDLYPKYSPSHPERHHGFWDVPLNRVRSSTITVVLKNHELQVKGLFSRLRLKPVWKGDIQLAGYCTLIVSLWETVGDKPKQLTAKSSSHFIPPADGELPLEEVSFHVTKRCNLTCRMCRRNLYPTPQGPDVTDEVLQPVLDASSRLVSIHFGGDGEPTLNPRLPEIVRKLKHRMPRGSKVGSITNAMPLNREKSRQIVDAGMDWMIFSFAGAEKATYEGIRVGSDFDTILKNIACIVEYGNRQRPGEMRFVINYTIEAANVQEIPAAIRLAGSLGINCVLLNHTLDYETGKVRILEPEILAPVLKESARIAREQGIEISLPGLGKLEKPRCPFMQKLLVFTSGDVGPCCARHWETPWLPVKIMGNVKNNSLHEIWNSDMFKQFREKVLSGVFPEECGHCDWKWGTQA